VNGVNEGWWARLVLRAQLASKARRDRWVQQVQRERTVRRVRRDLRDP
jgi:hypothetical protein